MLDPVFLHNLTHSRPIAELLAQLLFQGRLPNAFVPPRALRPLRELVRHSHSVARALALQRR